ncbi:MAG: UbiA family prenyltransferase [Candidatus Nealsonbacteria bacterium]|nr:UbiA family prenyltransferase [Candidatus Nealsonbacteria bacterium]
MNLKPYIELLRIKDWRAYFLMALFGFLLARGFSFPSKDIALFAAIVLSFLAFGFSINDTFDTKEDKQKKEGTNPLVKKEISFKNSLIFSILSAILGLALSMTFGLKVFLFCLTGILATYIYSAPPLRLKSRPLLDLISHGYFAGIFIFILPLLIFNPELIFKYYWVAFSIFYLSIIMELRNHLEDLETDKAAGLRTTACLLGREKSERLLRYLAIFFPLALLLVYFLISWPYLIFFLVSTLVFLLLFLLSKNHPLNKNYRILDIYALSILGLFAMVKMLC